jgi:hypothetical protein
MFEKTIGAPACDNNSMDDYNASATTEH